MVGRYLIAALVLLIAFESAAGEEQTLFEQDDRVVFIGDTLADQMRSNGYVETELTVRRPDLQLTFRNLSWPGDTLTRRPRPLNFGSLEKHLREQQADVIVVCFGMSASLDNPGGADNFAQKLTDFVGDLRSQKFNDESPPRLVLVSPIAQEHIGQYAVDVEARNRSLKQYTRAIRRVARELDFPFVDLFSVTKQFMADGKHRLTHNGIHLNDFGYWAVSDPLADALLGPDQQWEAEIDAAAGRVLSFSPRRASAEAQRSGISGVRSSENGLTFTVQASRLPSPPPPGKSMTNGIGRRLPRLTVCHLQPGRYALRIEGRFVRKADHRQWADGILLNNTPGQRQTEALRQEINRKNQWFFYRWRPANSEYVFGRRTKPFGAVSFPPEMKTFDELIAQQDRLIHKKAQSSRDEVWRLQRVKKSETSPNANRQEPSS